MKLLHVLGSDHYNTWMDVGEETQFQISMDGIIQYRKSIRSIAKLAVNNEERYQSIIDKTEGDLEVKEELKKIPEKIKNSEGRHSRVKAGLKKIPGKIGDKMYDSLAAIITRYGVGKVGIYITKLIYPEGNGGGLEI
jgi:hypothetical protein